MGIKVHDVKEILGAMVTHKSKTGPSIRAGHQIAFTVSD